MIEGVTASSPELGARRNFWRGPTSTDPVERCFSPFSCGGEVNKAQHGEEIRDGANPNRRDPSCEMHAEMHA